MQRTDIVNKLQEIHRELMCNDVNREDDDDLILDEPLDQQGYDSLDKAEFVMKAEKEFDLTVDDSTFDKLKTPNDVVDLLYDVLNVHKPTAQERAN